MAIPAGTRLGTYEITAHIGAGGMGEVYQARDTKLGRDVAIKVLPEQFAREPERLARFQREAKLLAALNHPNIATIHGLEQSGNTHYLVMELVPGDTLAQRIRNGAIPLDEALPIARQVADAVEYAHDKNVIHRDLKPANIKVTHDGAVKVLDFGLAKALSDDSTQEDISNSPTLSMAATRQGVILGTAAYMSPEQAKGKTVDRRTDVWAFGAVLYEMLTGKQAFHGEDLTDVLASVVKSEPAYDALPAPTPPRIRSLLSRCLDKNIKRRLPHIGEARILIEDVLSGAPAPDAESAPPALAAPDAGRLPVAWISVAAVFAIVAAGASLLAWRATRPAERPLMRFADNLSAEPFLGSQEGPAVAISPDGSRIAYITQSAGGSTRISLRLLENAQSNLLAGTEGASAPFFSPDGRWIGFFVNSALKKISVEGGAAVTLCDTGGNPRGGGFWTDDGYIFFANQTTPVLRVSANGGTPAPATQLDKQKQEVTNRAAQLLPGGQAFLFEASTNNNLWEDATIQVQNVKTGQRKTLVQGGFFGRYIHGGDPAHGHLLYMHGGTLFAAPMDVNRLELTGPAVPVLEDVANRNANGLAHIASSNSGTMAYIPGSNSATQQTLSWVDSAGNLQVLSAPPNNGYFGPQISPDGTRIAVVVQDAVVNNLMSLEPAQNRMTRLTFFQRISNSNPVWAPDGKHVVFELLSSELSGPGIYYIRSDGAGSAQQLVAAQNIIASSFSPDGKRLAYFELSGKGYGIWTLPLDLADPDHPKPGKPELFLESKSPLLFPKFSPDGRWLAYNIGGSSGEVFVRPFPGPGGQWQISNTGGYSPTWSRDGRNLIYQGGKGGTDIMVAPYIVKGDSFEAGQPHPWSEKPIPAAFGFDLAPDGKRALVVTTAPGANPADRQNQVTFLLNFADELRRKAPSDK